MELLADKRPKKLFWWICRLTNGPKTFFEGFVGKQMGQKTFLEGFVSEQMVSKPLPTTCPYAS
jgi:hypothetical protein